MKQGTTKDGFEFEVDTEALGTMEFIDDLAELDDGNYLAIPRVLKKMFSPEEKKKLYDHLRDEKGHVQIAPTVAIITEILNLCGEEGKNS